MATMKKTTKTMAKPKLKKAQTGGYNDTSGKKKLGPALGIGIPVTGMVAAGANMIKNAVKRRKERKATEEETRKALENAKSQRTKKSQVPAPFDKRKAEKARKVVAKKGGIKKYQTGGGKFEGPLTEKASRMINNINYLNNGYEGMYGHGKGPRDDEYAYAEKPSYTPAAVNAIRQTSLDPKNSKILSRNKGIKDLNPYVKHEEDLYYKALKKATGKGLIPKATYKTGGMVNPNAKVSALKKAGSKGVKPNVNPKATAAKRATGRTGGTSTAPRTAKPKKNK